jgi:hypothetical protein
MRNGALIDGHIAVVPRERRELKFVARNTPTTRGSAIVEKVRLWLAGV